MTDTSSRKSAIPPENVELFVSDIDGTLITSDGKISEQNLRCLQKAHDQGIHILLASGRMVAAMEPIAAQLGFPVCLCGYNGAVVYDKPKDSSKFAVEKSAEERDLLFFQPLNLPTAQSLFAWGKELGVQVNYYLDEFVYAENDPRTQHFIELYNSRTGSPFRVVDSLDPYLHRAPAKLLFVTTPEHRDELYAEVRASGQYNATILRSDPEYLEFLEPGVDKGSGLETVCNKLEVDIENTVAVGDAENDIPLLRRAKYGVAMKNARQATLEMADAVTENDNNNNGVAEVLERWVL